MRILIAALVLSVPMVGWAGIFSPAAGQSGSEAVSSTDPEIDSWATGYENYNLGLNVDAEFQTPEKGLGIAGDSDGTQQGTVYDVVTLGTGGSITLKFNPPIRNGAGADFAVFENSFGNGFLELARVEVSSDGQNFVAFPGFSQTPAPVASFGNLDPTDVEQLAGKHAGGYGTPFDLEQLVAAPALDMENIAYVRLVDVVGDGTAANDLSPAALAQYLGMTLAELPQALIDIANSAPAAIYDPYPTFGSAGFDLDAVAVLQAGTTTVPVDIDPADPANEIDPDSTAQIPVAVLTTSVLDGDDSNFDPAEIDAATLRFGYGQAEAVNGPFTSDLDGDGDSTLR